MIGLAKAVLGALGIDAGTFYQNLSARSIRAALREQSLDGLVEALRRIVPDVSDQYTAAFEREAFRRYWEIKIRGQQAFQIRSVLDTLARLEADNLTIVDIGDSSGNHAACIRALAPAGAVGRIVGVNFDAAAVEKIRAKGGEAHVCRAERLDTLDIRPDLLLSFETLEHLIDPIGFLRGLAVNGSADHLLVSVPYRRQSRFGGHHMRLGLAELPAELTPEAVHVHEYSVDDWRLLARFAGWETVSATIYRQYPLGSPLRLTAAMWRRLDFEGYASMLLKRDLRFASYYTGW